MVKRLPTKFYFLMLRKIRTKYLMKFVKSLHRKIGVLLFKQKSVSFSAERTPIPREADKTPTMQFVELPVGIPNSLARISS